MEPVWTTPAGNTVRMEVRPDTNDWNVCQSILAEDEYKIPSGLTGVAVDIGAHIGAATVRLLVDNPELRVVAVEPVPENLALLKQNTAPYGDRVTIIEGAAGKGKQRINYNWRGGEIERVHRYIANQYFDPGTEHDEIIVPGVTLTQLVKQYGPITFLKIDCEGCEKGFLDDPAIDQVERVVGEIHDGPAVRPMTEKPKRTKRAPRKRVAK